MEGLRSGEEEEEEEEWGGWIDKEEWEGHGVQIERD